MQIFDIERSGEIRKSILLCIEIVIKVLKILFFLIMLLMYLNHVYLLCMGELSIGCLLPRVAIERKFSSHGWNAGCVFWGLH